MCGALYGTKAGVKAAAADLRRALGRRWSLVVLDEAKLRRAERVAKFFSWLGLGLGERIGRQLALGRDVLDVMRGVPTNGALPGASWRVRGPAPEAPQDPLTANAGLLWVSPAAPATGSAARQVMRILEPIYEAHGFETLMTFTLITPRALCCVSNVAFDRRDAEESARAAACYSACMEALMAQGYIPYRTGPLGFQKLGRGSSVFWDVARELRAALDPRGLMSPGRYAPGAREAASVEALEPSHQT